MIPAIAEKSVTFERNWRSRSAGTAGHVQTESAVKSVRNTHSDGTVSLHGQRLEIPSRYRHLTEVHLRYARWDFSRVDLIEARSGTLLCAVRPLDKAANAQGLRRALEPTTSAATAMPDTGIAPLLKQMIADYAATGLPPAYLPTPEEDPT